MQKTHLPHKSTLKENEAPDAKTQASIRFPVKSKVQIQFMSFLGV